MRKFLLGSLSLILLGAVAFSGGVQSQAQAAGPLDKFVYLPMVSKQGCPTTSSNTYFNGLVLQIDGDVPVRPKNTHAGKNFDLRGYAQRTVGFATTLIDFGSNSGDPGGTPPQFDSLFDSGDRVQLSGNYYQMYDWNYDQSPNPGTRGALIDDDQRKISALGLATTQGEIIQVPSASREINPGYVAILLWADSDSLTMGFTRGDSTAIGYAVYIDNLCVDVNLLSLYNSLDTGNRYVFSGVNSETYNLPYLAIGQNIGTAKGTQIVVAVTDNGAFQDPRSCRGWWTDYQNNTSICPDRDPGNGIVRLPTD